MKTLERKYIATKEFLRLTALLVLSSRQLENGTATKQSGTDNLIHQHLLKPASTAEPTSVSERNGKKGLKFYNHERIETVRFQLMKELA